MFRVLTPARWPDLVKLFGERGACGGCWCMWWRLPTAQFRAQAGDGNRRAFEKIVRQGAKPGVLAYAGREPVGWCAIEPRGSYARLANARSLKAVDDQPVWSITCLFVRRASRNRGVAAAVVRAAVAEARRRGAKIIEAYPVESRPGRLADAFVYTGVPRLYTPLGFVEVARRAATRPIFRLHLS